MKSKITFPSAGTETKYVWDKYSIHNNGEHVWDKHNIDKTYKYKWDEYNIKEANSYTWKKYEAVEDYTYDWNRHTTNATTDYVWNYWDTNAEYIYIVFDGPFELDRNDTLVDLTHSGDSYYHFYSNNGIKSFSCADIISNNFQIEGRFVNASYRTAIEPLGYWGFSVNKSATPPAYPQYKVTSQTRLLVENGQTNITRLMVIKKGNALRRTLIQPDTEYYFRHFNYINTYLMSTHTSTNKDEYPNLLIDQDYRYYELQNDGFWNTETIGRTVNWEDYVVLSSTNENAYPSGFDGEYYYEYVGEEYTYKPGAYIEDVVGTSISDYPSSGYKDGYYYELSMGDAHHWLKYTKNDAGELQQIAYISTEMADAFVNNEAVEENGVIYYYNYLGYGDKVYHFKQYTTEEVELEEPIYNFLRYQAYPYRWASSVGGLYLNYTGDLDLDSRTYNNFCALYDVNDYDHIDFNKKEVRLYKAHINFDESPDFNLEGDFSQYDDYSIGELLELFNEGISPFYRHYIGINLLEDVETYGNKPRMFILRGTTLRTFTYSEDSFSYKTYFGFYKLASLLPLNPNDTMIDNYKNSIQFFSDYALNKYSGYSEYKYFSMGNYIDSDDNYYSSIIDEQYLESGRYVYFDDYIQDMSTRPHYIVGVRDEYYNPEEDLANTIMVRPTYQPDLRNELETYELDKSTLERITAPSKDSYKDGYYYDGYWYFYNGATTTETVKGQHIYTIPTADKNKYPQNGIQDGYWYELAETHASLPYQIGAPTGNQYISENKNDLPLTGGFRNGFWYSYAGYDTINKLGTKIGEVKDISYYAYPLNGIKHDYWYVYNRYIEEGPFKGNYIQQVESNKRNAYPDDGIMNGYWYDYNKSYIGYKLQIFDNQTQGGITYNHNVNPQSDFTIGNVACAEVEFKYFNADDDIQKYLDCEYFQYYTWQENDNDWRLIGTFWIDDCKYNRNIATIKAYDELIKSEQFVDEFIAQTQFPVSINTFYTSLLEYLGLSGYINGVLPNDYLVYDNFEATNITGRQLLQYIAEAVGGYIKVDQDGRVIVDRYQGVKQYLDNTKYVSYDASKFETKKIDGLIVKKTDDDVGVVSGESEGNIYIIKNNPLFYTDSTGEIQQQVNLIRSEIRDITYTPAKLKLLQDYNIQCGDIIEVNGNKFYVMSKKMTKSGVELECFGNQQREKKESPINADIVALRGKTNELVRDLESTKSTITDINSGLQSQISQTVESIETRITNEVEGLESKITQQAGSITSSVENQISQAKSEIKQTTDSISLSVQQQGNLVAQLSLDVDGILAKGYVTFTDLSGSGKTTINGDNITTGSISADRINLTGSISWNDLTQSCKNTIASYAGQDGSDAYVPDYIKSTYIDSVRIVSPTISGGVITAGTTAEGYITMASSGMNFASPEKNLIGLGFYPGKYEFPYIIFGDGVDSIGTDRGMIKKYEYGMWIGDNDNQNNDQPGGTGIFINFVDKKIYKYIDGVATEI